MLSSVGRASPLQGEGQWFKSTSTHQYVFSGAVVQLVRIPACHAGGRGFESRPDRYTLTLTGSGALHHLVSWNIKYWHFSCRFVAAQKGNLTVV